MSTTWRFYYYSKSFGGRPEGCIFSTRTFFQKFNSKLKLNLITISTKTLKFTTMTFDEAIFLIIKDTISFKNKKYSKYLEYSYIPLLEISPDLKEKQVKKRYKPTISYSFFHALVGVFTTWALCGLCRRKAQFYSNVSLN